MNGQRKDAKTLIQEWESRSSGNDPKGQPAPAPVTAVSSAQVAVPPAQVDAQPVPAPNDISNPLEKIEDTDSLIQGLTPAQIQVLAIKVFDLWLDELRLEQERYGRGR